MARWVVLLSAALAYLSHGAQAHLHFSSSETVSILICGQGTGATLDLTLGDQEPPSDTGEECCDNCVAKKVTHFAHPLLALDLTLKPATAMQAYQTLSIRPGGPLWPGAPPNGPPALI